MLDKKDILQITRDAVSELIGMGYDSSTETDIGTLDLSKLVEFGTTLTKGEGVTVTNELWNNTLIGKCAKFVVETRRFKSEFPRIFKTNYEWGGFIEKVKFDLAEIYDSLIYSQSALTTQGNKFYGKTIAEIEHGMYKTNYESKIYKEFKDFMIPYTKPNESLKSGLRTEADMIAFMSGLETAVANTVTLIVNTYGHALISSAIAYSVTGKGSAVTPTATDGSGTAIHLLTEYKRRTGDTSWTAEKMLKDSDAMAWIAERIANVKGFMRNVSAKFNNHTKAIPSITTYGVMLDEVYNAYTYESSRVSMNPVSLGDWDTVSCWQSSTSTDGDSFDFTTNSTIAITKDESKGIYNIGESSLGNFEQSGVIAVLYDEYAIGMTLDHNKTTSSYTGATDTVNIFMNKRLNYIIDTDYPIVAFVLD